jgi:phosphate-selective porin OprO/OprP
VRVSAQNITRYIKYIAILCSCFSLNGWCQQESGQDVSIYDKIWAVPVLYENADNPKLQSFSLIGRYHGQYWSVDADQGSDADWENRRKIFGFNSVWFRHFTVQAQMFLKTNESGSLYGGLYVGYIMWTPQDSNISLSVGRLDYLFTGYERSESSKKINVIERGLLVNQIMPAEVVGAHFQDKRGRFSYHPGLFSQSIEQEFDYFNSGSAAVIGASYDTKLLYKKGRLHLDYLHNSGDSEGNAFRPYRHVISLWHRGESGRLGMGFDLTMAKPLETNGHVFGLTIEPTWMLLNEVFGNNDSLQLAVRYQYANSNEDNGLTLQRRYEQEVTHGEGNNYQALYAGLNYYLYGHKLKLMMGGEYARMEDDADDGGQYGGWTWFGAVRLYF